jgi:YaiO family outer membrane protein
MFVLKPHTIMKSASKPGTGIDRLFAGIFMLIVIMSHATLWANSSIDPDQLFNQARVQASQNNYQQARDICDQILAQHPNYYDASILKARTYAWEQNYNPAREILNQVRQEAPRNNDALYALIDVEMWSQQYKDAISLIDIALQDQPNNTTLLYQKAFALVELGDETAAAVLLNQILDIDPSHKQAQELLDRITTRKFNNFAGLGYRGHYFSQETDPWHLFYAELGRRTRLLGPLTARVNYANRFSDSGLQLEVDAYPTLRQGTYLYLNAGYSPDENLFPTTRFGFEIFQTIPFSWELSAGFRLLNFEKKDLLIFTGSINKYYRKYFFSFRPYISISSNADDPSNQSYFFTIKRYFTSPDHSLTLVAGRGFSADFDRLSGGEIYDIGGTLAEAMLLYQQPITSQILFKIGAGFKKYDSERSVVPWGNPLVVEGGIIKRF